MRVAEAPLDLEEGPRNYIQQKESVELANGMLVVASWLDVQYPSPMMHFLCRCSYFYECTGHHIQLVKL